MRVTIESFDKWVEQRRETHSIENLNVVQAEDCNLCRKSNVPVINYSDFVTYLNLCEECISNIKFALEQKEYACSHGMNFIHD